MAITNFTNKAKRFSVLVLPYEKKDMAVAKELIIDYDNGHIYVVDKTGTRIISITKDLQDSIDNIINNGGNIINVTNPSDNTTQILNDVLKNIYNYVNASVEGLCIKKPARLLCDTNIAVLNGLPGDIDNVTVNDGDDILLIAQDDKRLNGKWKVNASGDWKRSDDLNSQTELVRSAFFFIDEGDKYKSTGWLLTTDNPVIDSSDLEFEIFSRQEDILAGTGLVRTGNEFSLAECVIPGTATKVRWDQYGRIVGWENPTTLFEYGITDAVPLSHIGSGGDQHAIVTVDEHGFSSKEDKQMLDSLMPTIEDLEIKTNEKLNIKSEIEFISQDPIEIQLQGETEIVNDLLTDSATKALAAGQGKVLYDLLNYLFQNTNEDGTPYTKLWMGTLSQYYNLLEKDPVTLYMSTDYVNENTALSMGSNVEEIIMMLQLMQSSKVSKEGDIVNGDLIVGSSVKNQNLKVYGNIYINGVLLDQAFAPIDHEHDDMVSQIDFDAKLKKKADKYHTHVIPDVEGLKEALDSKAAIDHTHNLIYYDKEELDFLLSTKAPVNHKHKVADIIDLFTKGDSTGAKMELWLKNMISDPLHRTVTDAQIARWEQMVNGTSTNTGGISKLELDSHNNDSNAHPDIRESIREILDELGSASLTSNLNIKESINELYTKLPTVTNSAKLMKEACNVIITQDNTTNVPIGFTGFDPDIHTLLVFKNSTYYHPIEDYTMNGTTSIDLTKEIVPSGTIFTFVVLWVEGDVLGGGSGSGSISQDIYDLLDNKADLDHEHKLKDLIDDPLHRTVTDAMIDRWNNGTTSSGNNNGIDAAMLIAAHNVDTTSHDDLRTKVDEIYNNMSNVLFKTKVIELIPTRDNQTEFSVNMNDLAKEKYGHFVMFNSTATSDYVLSDYKLKFNEPCNLTDKIKLVLFWIDGNILVQNSAAGSVAWDSLTQAVKNTINNKIDKTEVYTKTELDTLINSLASTTITDDLQRQIDDLKNNSTSSSNVYTKSEIDTILLNKANSGDTYTKTEIDNKFQTIDNAINSAANMATKTDLDNYYTKTEIDNKFQTIDNAINSAANMATKADLDNYYNKTEIDNKLSGYYSKTEIDNKINALSNRITALESRKTLVPITEAEYNALSTANKNDTTKIYAIY
jgi:hypothetical protein